MSKNKSKMLSNKLNTILENSNGSLEYVFGEIDKEISSIEYDSRKVKKNSLFVAIQGFETDGHSYINDALNRGAKTIIISKERVNEFLSIEKKGITLLSSEDTRKELPVVSSAFFKHPTLKVPVIGITGTNGKTSITYMLESILKCNGMSPGVIGTVNYRWKENEIQSHNTTPESKDLQEIFSKMIEDGADSIIIEVSSHALELYRADNIHFDTVIFTNLTRDHLDFHNTFEEYFEAKKRILKLLELSQKENKTAIINIDDEYGRTIYDKKGTFSFPMFSFGIENEAEYKPEANSIKNTIEGISYIMEKPEEGTSIELKVTGKFHVYNSLCVLAACHRMGIPVSVIQQGFSELVNIPGRFDRIKSKLGFNVIIDYAHTDDALLNVLRSANELQPKRLITIFGCGGNRDKTTRPLMGKAATLYSDWVIITSDNPRDEEPQEIIEDIIKDLDSKNYEILLDRETAIKKAISMAERDDLIVIAGKGHENYQIIGNKRVEFDDRLIAREYIDQRESC